jgi:hypothetical protein
LDSNKRAPATIRGADAEVHLKLVKAHLAVMEAAEQTEVNLSETMPPMTPRMPTKVTGAVPTAPWKIPMRRAKMASAAKKKDSTDEPRAEGESFLEGGQDGAPPPAIHPLDSCKGFGDLSVTKRRKVLKERNLCECCFMDCRDKETGARCYR